MDEITRVGVKPPEWVQKVLSTFEDRKEAFQEVEIAEALVCIIHERAGRQQPGPDNRGCSGLGDAGADQSADQRM